MTTWFAHVLIGIVFYYTGMYTRSKCEHKGWLPHPKSQLALGLGLIMIEAAILVPVVG